MPNALPFKLERRFNNFIEYNNFKSQIFDFAIDHSKKQNCSECKKQDHKMRVQYGSKISQ